MGRHQTLLFHRVLQQADPLLADDPDRAAFEGLMRYLQRHFNVIPLQEAIELSASDELPRASLSITFDDGYADNVSEALPILQKLALPATFFVATDYLDGGRMWNDTVIETVRRSPLGTVESETRSWARKCASASCPTAPAVILRWRWNCRPARRWS